MGLECGVWYRQQARFYGGKCEQCRNRGRLKRKRDDEQQDQGVDQEREIVT